MNSFDVRLSVVVRVPARDKDTAKLEAERLLRALLARADVQSVKVKEARLANLKVAPKGY